MKMPAAATAERMTTTSARLAALTTPVSSSTATTARAATAMPIHVGYWLRGRGSGTTWTDSGMFLRAIVYWIRPIAMPTAARPKPKWKPHSFCSHPVSSGPSRPPMFTPM